MVSILLDRVFYATRNAGKAAERSRSYVGRKQTPSPQPGTRRRTTTCQAGRRRGAAVGKAGQRGAGGGGSYSSTSRATGNYSNGSSQRGRQPSRGRTGRRERLNREGQRQTARPVDISNTITKDQGLGSKK